MRVSAALFALLVAGTAISSAASLAQSDRERALSELQASRKQFLDSITGLSQAQWTYKAAPDRWSIAEVAEHIVAAEDFIGRGLMGTMMSAPADPAKAEQRKPGISKMDEAFLAGLRNRTQKQNAPGEIVPKGIYKTPAEATAQFKAAREKTLDYARTTQDSLRDHFSTPFPGFEMDGVQALLMIAGHTERHVAQIEQVKRDPGYPARLVIDDRLRKNSK